MKYSVIIPCFNEQDYLGQCLEGLCQQTKKPDEVIVCDNNSTDNTVSVAKSYKKRLPIKIIHQPIKGIRPTTEAAWRAATGDIVIRTDADALSPPNWIKNIASHFDKDPELAACGGICDSLDGNIFMKIFVRITYSLSNLFFLPKGYRMLFGPNMALRRFAYEQINGYISDDPYIVDDEMISKKLAKHGLKYRRFYDCINKHSTRRFNHNPLKMFMIVKTVIHPKYYEEKST